MKGFTNPKSAAPAAKPSPKPAPEEAKVEGKKAGKFTEVKDEEKKKEARPISGSFLFTVKLGAKLPIPGINYSSQDAEVTVSGDNFDDVMALAQEKYKEASNKHIAYFERAVRTGSLNLN